jgi:predicted Zn-dependent peptidase
VRKTPWLAVLTIFVLLLSLDAMALVGGFQSLTLAQPVLKRDSLLNGLPLIVLERRGTGSVSVRLRINSGAMFDLAGKGGLADVTAGMLLRGGGGWTAKDLRESVSQSNLSVNITVGWDSTDISVLGPAYGLEGIFDLLSRIVITPAFDQKELESMKVERVEALKREQGDQGLRLMARAMEAVFGMHPYGRPHRGTSESVARITRADLLYFHSRFYLANNAEMVIIGEAVPEEVTRLARSKLGAWKKGDKIPATFRPPEQAAARRVIILDGAESPVTDGVIAQVGVSRREKDYFAAMMAVEVLRKRVAKYALSSPFAIEVYIDPRFLRGPFWVKITSPSGDLARSIELVLEEMTRLREGQISAEEIEWARSQLLAAQAERVEKVVEDVVLDIELYELGRDYLVTFADRVAAVTSADVLRAVQSYLKPQQSTVVVRGSAVRFDSMLKKLGAVTVMP